MDAIVPLWKKGTDFMKKEEEELQIKHVLFGSDTVTS